MKHSLSQGSGYLTIDHRNSPGLSPEDIAHVPGAVLVGAGKHFETDIQMCTHCQRGVLLRPDRVRARGYCPKCDHYICDLCAGVFAVDRVCMPVVKQFDILQNYIEREGLGADPLPPDPPRIVLTD